MSDRFASKPASTQISVDQMTSAAQAMTKAAEEMRQASYSMEQAFASHQRWLTRFKKTALEEIDARLDKLGQIMGPRTNATNPSPVIGDNDTRRD